MNYVIVIVDRADARAVHDHCGALSLPVVLTAYGRGTATGEMLDLLGLEEREKAVVMAVAGPEKTAELIKYLRRSLYIDIPGRGIVVSVPIKSVGGGRTLAFLSDNSAPEKAVPKICGDYELIAVILNEGYSGLVMDAARSAGAPGGTAIHAKGTGSADAEKFYRVSIAQEKELIMIVAKSSRKADIMRAILKDAGPDSEAGAIVFSLPVCDIAGLSAAGDE